MSEPISPSALCRNAELEQLHAKVESADSARIADLRTELSAAMSEVAAKVSTDLSKTRTRSLPTVKCFASKVLAHAYHFWPTVNGA